MIVLDRVKEALEEIVALADRQEPNLANLEIRLAKVKARSALRELTEHLDPCLNACMEWMTCKGPLQENSDYLVKAVEQLKILTFYEESLQKALQRQIQANRERI